MEVSAAVAVAGGATVGMFVVAGEDEKAEE